MDQPKRSAPANPFLTLWHYLRQTKRVAGLTQKIERLEHRARALRQRNEELKQQVAELEERLESVQSMLYSSRAVYGESLQRISELETELAEHRDFEEQAARAWLDRPHDVVFSTN